MKNCILQCFWLLTSITLNAQTTALWQQTKGPEGGYVFDMSRNTSTVFVATDDGIWASDDEGQSWKPLHGDLNDLRIISLYSTDTEILALAIRYSPNYGEVYLVLRSTDAGQSWEQHPVSDTPPYIYISAYPDEVDIWREGGRIWITSNYALYKSEDNAQTWSETPRPADAYFSEIAVSGNKILAYTYYDRYESDDEGANWTVFADTSYIQDLYVDGEFVLRLSSDSIFVSNDFGQSWQGAPSGFYSLNGMFRMNDGSLAMIQSLLYRSADGLNWQTLTQPGAYYGVSSGVASGDAFLVAGSQGIFRSVQNNSQFERSEKGFINTRISSMAVMANGKLFASTSYSGTWSSINNGLTWEPVADPVYPYPNIVFSEMIATGDTLWAIGSNDSLYRMVGNSNTWTNITGADAWFAGESFFRIIENDVYLVEDARIRRTKDGGATWQVLVSDTAQPIDGLRDIAKLGNQLFFTTNDGFVYRSDDDGLSWQFIYEFWSPGAHRYNKLGVVGGRLIIWSEYECYFSTDAGASWQSFTMTGLPPDDSGDVYFEPTDLKYYQNIILCTMPFKGVWVSFDQGISWESLNQGLTRLRGRRLLVDGSNIFMGGTASGVWQLDANFEVFSGLVYNDLNQNGVKDNGEPPLKNIVVSAEPLGSYSSTGPGGEYSLVAASALDTIRVALPNDYCSVLPAFLPAGQSGTGYDFGIHFTEGIIDLKLDLTNWTPFRPGFDNKLTLTVTNVGNETVWDGWVELPIPDHVTVTSIYPFGAYVENDTLKWEVFALTPFESSSIEVSVEIDAAVMIGDILSFDGHVAAGGDVQSLNNYAALRSAVVGSYDPNDKSANEFITPEELSAGYPIEYTIRFENTGNFWAEKVVISDFLESNLDPATIRFVSSSHPCTWKLKQNGTVEITFADIFLLPGGTGFVKFSVEADRGLALNESVFNTAEIYFDFNAPIVTNTVKTTIREAVSDQGPVRPAYQLQLSPNPAVGFTLMTIPREALGRAVRIGIFDRNGRQVGTQKNLSERTAIDLSALDAGVYDIMLLGERREVLGCEKIVVPK